MSLHKHQVFVSSALFLLASLQANAADVTISVTDVAGTALANAVVYAEPVGKAAPKPNTTGMIEQKNKQFIPLVSVVQSGSNINFPNRDLVRHHVYSFSPAKTFELKLYSGIPANPVMFDKAGTVVLGCNIHDTMLAYIHIVDTPYFAKTDDSGKAKLSDLPAGQYQLKVWHYATLKENLITEQNLNVKGSESASFKLEVQNK
ncbi:MAG: methylamine utilization protein [Methylotenera sp. 24-45-7]|jgi:plastocyanin|nr:MAG: methylamine utilization protein [Methylotenera sp. 24-45-7]OZA53520.1 MAG: methylamine utilization protein [Methylophilales bacterium 39-45-7]HQS36947.1 methylamine utilization protein [Methylotenera sp.]HQS44284.1 methylamine utilization protein [Methylotenera sp.]